jgi:hypothetical protein
MNSEFILTQAGLFADRVISETGPKASSDDQIRHAWQLACGEAPGKAEFIELKKLLDEQAALLAAAKDKKNEVYRKQQALTILCQVLFQTNRFLYID